MRPTRCSVLEIAIRMRLDLEASYRGRDGVRAFIQSYQDAFGDLTYEPQWIVDLGGDVFVMLLHQSLRGRASGASVEQVSAHRVEFHDGLIVREEVFFAPGHDWTSLAQAVGLDRAELARKAEGLTTSCLSLCAIRGSAQEAGAAPLDDDPARQAGALQDSTRIGAKTGRTSTHCSSLRHAWLSGDRPGEGLPALLRIFASASELGHHPAAAAQTFEAAGAAHDLPLAALHQRSLRR